MKEYFLREFSETRILDFNDGFREKKIPIEVRTDRFTGRVSRILPFRMRLPEPSHPMELIEEAKKNCPFCPERLQAGTPRFPDEIVPGGRLRHGSSVVIPNAFPYCRFCGVTIFAPDHYIPMDRITETILSSALQASLQWFDLLYRHDPTVRYYAVNWNYMPTAGGSLFHPHFQVVANPAPTVFHRRLIDESSRYRERHGSVFWADLLQSERQQKQRHLFSRGPVDFLTSFSPGGIFGEVLALFNEKERLGQIEEKDWAGFVSGLARVLRTFSRLHLDCLNMTLLLSRDGEPDMWTQARIMPRVIIPPWGTSDVNYFEKGHDERVVVFAPEALAEEIRKDAD